jgi:hypothetical protein
VWNEGVYREKRFYQNPSVSIYPLPQNTKKTLNNKMRNIILVSLIMLTIGLANAETYSIELHTGWNLISTPLEPDNNSLWNNINSDIDAVYSWNPVTQDWTYQTYEYMSWWGNLTTFEAGRGYWIHATKKQNLTIFIDLQICSNTKIGIKTRIPAAKYKGTFFDIANNKF